MKEQGKFQNVVIVLLIVAIITMSIGFAAAAFNQQLNIDGNVVATKAVWDVKFDDSTFEEEDATGYVASTSHTASATTVNFETTLNLGEKYAFDIDVVNAGTLAAKLTSITMSSLSAEQQKYLTYTVTVNNTPYTASASNLNVALAAEGTHPVHVEVEYKIPEQSTDLPSDNTTVNLTAVLNYDSVLEG